MEVNTNSDRNEVKMLQYIYILYTLNTSAGYLQQPPAATLVFQTNVKLPFHSRAIFRAARQMCPRHRQRHGFAQAYTLVL